MTTTDRFLFLKNKKISLVKDNFHTSDNDIRYSNLYLKQSYKSSNVSTVHSQSKSYKDKNYVKRDCSNFGLPDSTVPNYYEKEKTLKLRNKSSDLCFNTLTLNDKNEKEEVKKCWTKSSNFNNSTLSLHISAYEKSVESADLFDKNNEKREEHEKMIFTAASAFFVQNPFEFPRQQQNAKVSEPEASQFKASQSLLNFNKTSKNARSDMGKKEEPADVEVEEIVPEAPVKKKKRRQTDINGSDQPSSSKPNGVRHTMDPSDFNQLGFETESDHVIAVMDHFKLKESETPEFTEHVYKTNKKIYSFKNKAASEVTFLGKEKNDEDDNYDYCLAIYNRRTRELEYKPISMLRFEGIPNIDPEVLTGKDVKKKVNYSANYSIDQQSFADRRRQLTTQFGSEKKNKMLEATLRRQINDDTLTTLSKSTFESKNVVKKTADDDKKAFATAESSVLPPANRSATIPGEIYKLSLFYTEFTLQSFGKIAQDFFKENNEMAKLTALGIPKLVAEVASKVMHDQESEKECFLVLKLIIMSIFVQQMAANKKSLISSEFDNFPSAIFHHVRDEFFSEPLKTNKRWGYTIMERDTFVAWFLCLFLILNDFRVAITPLASQLRLSENQSGKTLSALGCIVSSATVEESRRYDTMRMARLLEPPTEKKLRKRIRGRGG